MRLFLLALILVLLAAANVLVGSVSIPPADMIAALAGTPLPHGSAGTPDADTVRYILLAHRLPQVVVATLAGAALAGGGLAMQTLFRNPLADPSLLGINSGAALGAALVLLLPASIAGPAMAALPLPLLVLLAALGGAGGALAALLGAARRLRSTSALLVVGVMLSLLCASGVALLNYCSTAQGVRAYLLWGMGDFSAVAPQRLPLFAIAIGVPLAALGLMVKPLDALLLGEDYARSLGLDTRRARRLLLLIVGTLCAVVTAFCGPIAFIGLAAPHTARLLLRAAAHRRLLPATLLLGSITTLLCLLIAHAPTGGSLLPPGVITPMIGAPIVIGLLLRR